MRVLVLGASGMLGNTMARFLAADPSIKVIATYRKEGGRGSLERIGVGASAVEVDVLDEDALAALFDQARPDATINCVGLVKQLAQGNAVVSAVPINTLLPHRLAGLCAEHGARLVHFSTDCVFSGRQGMYVESDAPDARDVYGLTKYLGEVGEAPAVTLRTSMIGHELASSRSLVDWFLSQEGRVKGFRRAVFSGLPTVELARIVRDYVLPRTNLIGLLHVSADPIDKYTLLQLVARQYGKSIEIEPDDELVIDRSLDSSRFRRSTGYRPPSWPELVAKMYRSR